MLYLHRDGIDRDVSTDDSVYAIMIGWAQELS